VSFEWEQVGTVELLALRVYPIDPYASADLMPNRTEVAVEPGIYPVYRKYDAYRWVMRGRINERTAKIGDGLFAMNNGDVPSGLEVQFPSAAFGPEQFAAFLAEPVCQPGPAQRLRFSIDEMETQ
jgi:hypothetical protein